MDALLPPAELTVDALVDRLLAQGIDARAIERARLVARDSGQRLDIALLRLGLLSERQLAEAAAALLGGVVVAADRYPASLPDCAALLTPRFLRAARALPLCEADGELTVAVADALDRFTPLAIAAATGRTVRVQVAVPVELEAALNRLLPETDAPPAQDADTGPLEDDAERLKDMASEAPVIRLVNQIISRAVETGASDVHIEPFEQSLRVRYRFDGVLQEADSPPVRLAAAIVSRIKIMARTAASASRCAVRTWISASPRWPRCTARRWCCGCSTATPSPSTGTVWDLPRPSCTGWKRRWRCRTASCW